MRRRPAAVLFVVAVGVAMFLMPSGIAAAQSNSFAGYYGSGPNPQKVSATFVMPSFTCTATQQFAITAQLDGTSDNTVSSAITVACDGPGIKARYDASVCVSGAPGCQSTLKVVPGNEVEISLSETSTKSKSTMKDETTGKSESVSGGGGTISSAFVGDSANGSSTIPTFTSVKFTEISVNGEALGEEEPSSAGNMTDASGTTLVKTGALNQAGNSFKTTFENNG
jgi:hypothetical protein